MTKRASRKTKLAGQVGARIYVLRMERGFTLRQLAEAADCSLATVCNIESGVSGGTTTILRRIARALRVELFDLFNVDTHTDDVGYVLERMRKDPGALRLVSELVKNPLALSKMRAGSSVPVRASGGFV